MLQHLPASAIYWLVFAAAGLELVHQKIHELLHVAIVSYRIWCHSFFWVVYLYREQIVS